MQLSLGGDCRTGEVAADGHFPARVETRGPRASSDRGPLTTSNLGLYLPLPKPDRVLDPVITALNRANGEANQAVHW